MPPLRKTAPGPTGGFPGYALYKFQNDPLRFLQNIARDYGDVARLRLGAQPVTLINHPDLIHDVLVTNAKMFHKGRRLKQAKRLLGEGILTSEGEFHLRQRRLVQPAFHRQRIGAMASAMAECAERFQVAWQDGETRDAFAEMLRLTLAVVGKTLFAAEMEAEADGVHAALAEAFDLFQFLTLPFSEWLERIPFLPAPRRFAAAKARLDAVIYDLIAERRGEGGDKGDLLSMLMAARDEETGTPMDDVQIRGRGDDDLFSGP